MILKLYLIILLYKFLCSLTLKNDFLLSINKSSIYGHISIKFMNFFEVRRTNFAFLCSFLIDLIKPSA